MIKVHLRLNVSVRKPSTFFILLFVFVKPSRLIKLLMRVILLICFWSFGFQNVVRSTQFG